MGNGSTRIRWNNPICSQEIANYHIQFATRCNTNQITEYTSISNETSVIIHLQFNSCTTGECYFRVRGEFVDGSFTSYSPCVQMSYQLISQRKFSISSCSINSYLVLTNVLGFVYKYTDVCTQVVSCHLATSTFFVNGQLTSWHFSTSQFNITYNSHVANYNFCFKEVIKDTILTEYCHVNVPISDLCSICSRNSGIIRFVSHSELILLKEPLAFTQG